MKKALTLTLLLLTMVPPLSLGQKKPKPQKAPPPPAAPAPSTPDAEAQADAAFRQRLEVWHAKQLPLGVWLSGEYSRLLLDPRLPSTEMAACLAYGAGMREFATQRDQGTPFAAILTLLLKQHQEGQIDFNSLFIGTFLAEQIYAKDQVLTPEQVYWATAIFTCRFSLIGRVLPKDLRDQIEELGDQAEAMATERDQGRTLSQQIARFELEGVTKETPDESKKVLLAMLDVVYHEPWHSVLQTRSQFIRVFTDFLLEASKQWPESDAKR